MKRMYDRIYYDRRESKKEACTFMLIDILIFSLVRERPLCSKLFCTDSRHLIRLPKAVHPFGMQSGVHLLILLCFQATLPSVCFLVLECIFYCNKIKTLMPH